MPQLWQGRSSKAVDSRVNDFNSSIRFDARMIEQDIHGSMVHSAMLGKQGIISQQDVDDIHKGLQSILNDLHSGALEIDPNAEDVHTFVEQTLTARIGRCWQAAAHRPQPQRPGGAGYPPEPAGSIASLAGADQGIDPDASATRQKEYCCMLCPVTPICSVPSRSPLATS